MYDINEEFDEEYIEDFEEGYDIEDGFKPVNLMGESTDNLFKTKEMLEIKFKVKKDFEKLFKAIQRTFDEISVTILNGPISISDMIQCIDLKSKTIDRWALYTLINNRAPKSFRKQIKKKAKKELALFLAGEKETPFEEALCIGMNNNNPIEYTEVIEEDNGVYCRLRIASEYLSQQYQIERTGEKIGNFAEKVVEAVKVSKIFGEQYELLKFEVENNCLKVHGILDDDVNIRLIDKNKIYVVKADVMIPESMISVIKQVDKVDKIIESVEKRNKKYKFQLMYEKLVYNYNMTCAFLRDHAYNEKLYEQRDYEKEQLFKSLDEDVKKVIMSDNNDYIFLDMNCGDESAIGLAAKVLKVEENRFSDDYKHWIFKGTFTNIDRKHLESGFKKLKDNIQSHGVAEQYVDIKVAEAE